VIRTFADGDTRDLYTTGKSKRFPTEITRRAVRKLEYIDLAIGLDDLKVPLKDVMSIENKRERKIRPTHPGEMLREDFLPDYGLTVSSLAQALGVSRQTINWRVFPDNHVGELASIDFLTVPTASFRVLIVLIVLAYDRRRIVHFNVTEHPTALWTAQQMLEAFCDGGSLLRE
jgi:hypothetical protein